jgi:hypothetical protein
MHKSINQSSKSVLPKIETLFHFIMIKISFLFEDRDRVVTGRNDQTGPVSIPA